MNIQEDVLFIGRGATAVAYYRCMLPAMALDCDWTGVTGKPPDLRWRTGIARKGQGRSDSSMPDLFDYKVVVMQYQVDPEWFDLIDRWKKAGVKVLFEIDDYLAGAAKVKSHDFRKRFTKDVLTRVETFMRMCDGIIVSTPFLAKRYGKFNPNVFVCENAIDLARYRLTIPKRETVNIGWAGATGHKEALLPWLHQVAAIMRIRPDTTFLTIGQPWAGVLHHLGIEEERAMAIPFATVEQYPAAMTMMDIALAPAGKGSFFRGKSDLRWLEAGALGIPIIADPMVYPKIEEPLTGFHAEDPQQAAAHMMRLLNDPTLRAEVGERVKTYVQEKRSFPDAADQWLRAIEAVVD